MEEYGVELVSDGAVEVEEILDASLGFTGFAFTIGGADGFTFPILIQYFSKRLVPTVSIIYSVRGNTKKVTNCLRLQKEEEEGYDGPFCFGDQSSHLIQNSGLATVAILVLKRLI